MPKLSDTGPLSIKARARSNGSGQVLLEIEVWTSAPILPNAERCIRFEALMGEPLSEAAALEAGRQLEAAYRGVWRDTGASPPPEWKQELAFTIGQALAQEFARSLTVN